MSLLAAAAAVLFASTNPPQPDLFPGVEFIRIPVTDRAPDLRMGGMVLDARGLSVEGRLRCTWPGGRFDPDDTADMVLGYDETMSSYTPCDAWPLLSTWGDGGVGGATLYLAITAVEGATALVRVGDSFVDVALPSNWTPFETRTQRRARERADAAAVLSRPDVRGFLDGVRACLRGRAWEAGLAARMTEEIRDPEAAPGTAVTPPRWSVTPEEYARFLRESSRIEDVRGCFADGAHVRADDRLLVLESESGVCEVERTADGWRLRGFLPGC